MPFNVGSKLELSELCLWPNFRIITYLSGCVDYYVGYIIMMVCVQCSITSRVMHFSAFIIDSDYISIVGTLLPKHGPSADVYTPLTDHK